uniref:Cuticle protein 18.6, isoform B n=1 Tax=Caligus clemensi TaxID=344056 RepID=C1BZV8_CALCM|nr:Cuticle protein 18.6, isoform B [Caligus clemensi]
MFLKFAVLCLSAFAVASAAPSAPAGYGAPLPPPAPVYEAPPSYGVTEPVPSYAAPAPAAPEPIPPYAFNYAALDAESKTDFSAEEESKDGVVVGQYKVLRADGIIMTVTYTVDGDAGFVADIATEAAPAGSGYGAPEVAPIPAYGAPEAASAPDYGAPVAPLPAYLPSYA